MDYQGSDAVLQVEEEEGVEYSGGYPATETTRGSHPRNILLYTGFRWQYTAHSSDSLMFFWGLNFLNELIRFCTERLFSSSCFSFIFIPLLNSSAETLGDLFGEALIDSCFGESWGETVLLGCLLGYLL